MYKFPIITSIDQVRAALADRDEFVEIHKDGYIVFDYMVNFEDTFPPVLKKREWTKLIRPPESWIKDWPHDYDENAALRRECRGLLFDSVTGTVIGRRYHKFFNLGERDEVRRENIDWTIPHIILEKLDGSMITPFLVNGKVLWGTKKGETEVSNNVHTFLQKNVNYEHFAFTLCSVGYTPIFEWCSRKNRIVVDHPEDRLVLTAIRENISGEYHEYDRMVQLANTFHIEVVKKFEFNLDSALATLTDIEDEGYVVRFENGHMVKMKGTHYLLLHKTMEHLLHEKDVLRLVLENKIDDVKAYLPDDLKHKLDVYSKELFETMMIRTESIAWVYLELFDKYGSSKKNFALAVKDRYSDISGVLFKMYDKQLSDIDNVKEFVYNYIHELLLKNTGSQGNVDKVKHWIMNLTWEV